MRKHIMMGIACLGLATVSVWAENPLKEMRQVTVEGHGKVSTMPDMAKIELEVSEEGPAIKDLTTIVANKMTSLFKMLRAQGIADKDLHTQGYTISPLERYENGKTSRVGYTVSENMGVTVRDISKIGTLLANAQEAGINTINGPQFGFTDPQALERRALTSAIEDAKAKATLLAQAAQSSLGQVLRIEEGNPTPPIRPLWAAKRLAMVPKEAEAPPIAAGEESTEATVTVTYALQ